VFARRSSALAAGAALPVVLAWLALAAVAGASQPTEVGRAVAFALTPPLRSIRPIPPPAHAVAPPVLRRSNEQAATPVPPAAGRLTPGASPFSTDSARQSTPAATATPIAGAGWSGLTNTCGCYPPDTEGDVGPSDYVQWVNVSFEIWDKSGKSLYGPAAGNTLWSALGSGNVCATSNQGDPIVVYDRLADRWVFSQFAWSGSNPKPPYYICIAVSRTGDPTGQYNAYAFQVNTSTNYFPDYPKLAVWPDGYYLTTNNFGSHGNGFYGAAAFAFDRSQMLSGAPATFIEYQLGPQYEGLLPADVTGPIPPPAGAPEPFGAVDTSSSSGTGATFQLWDFHADFSTPSNSYFRGPGQATNLTPTSLPVATYNFQFCGQAYSSSCIPQPGTSTTLDPLADRLMYRLNYRNFGDHETLTAAHTVDVGAGSSSSNSQAGTRWYEIRLSGGSCPSSAPPPCIYQQSTFAPDSLSRWMGSVNMDGDGDIALGYSESSSSTYPSIGYTARLASDPLNTMAAGDNSLMAGGGYQASASRWGDYSSMSIDPCDDATFWYTQEYYTAGNSGTTHWSTRIGSFKLANAPIVTLLAPAGGGAGVSSSPTYSGTAAEPCSGDGSVTVNVYSGSSASGTPVQTLTVPVSSTGSWSVPASSTLSSGTYTAQAQQSDTDGHTGYSSANTFVVDTTPPVNSVSVVGRSGGGSYLSGSTLYYQGSAAGSFELQNAVSDSGSGPASSAFSALGGTATGWSFTPSTVSSPSGGPYVSNAFSWVGGTSSAPTETVTGADNAGNTAQSTLTFLDDEVPPNAAVSASYGNGAVSISFSATDGGSGVNEASGQLQRASAPLSNGSCGTFGAFGDIGPVGPTSPYSDTSISSGTCYAYRYSVSDNVGNQTTSQSAEVATPSPPLSASFSYVPTAPPTGQAVTFTSSSTGTSSGTTYGWSFGDGSGATGATATHAYAHAGIYAVTLTVTDGGSQSQATHPITVADRPPSAFFGWLPLFPVVGQSVAFDGTASSDPDGTVNSFAWSFGDASATATGATVTHSFTRPGTYTVQLSVTDDSGSVGTTAQPVTISPVPGVVVPARPIIRLAVPRQRLASVRRQGLVIRVWSSQAVRARVRLALSPAAAKALRLGNGRRAVVVASLARRWPAGRTLRVVLKLTRSARERLAHARSVRLALTLSATGPGGMTSLTQRLLLRR